MWGEGGGGVMGRGWGEQEPVSQDGVKVDDALSRKASVYTPSYQLVLSRWTMSSERV